MTLGDAVWWLVLTRALVGTVFIVIGLQMVLYARDERRIRRERGRNGMEDEILTGQIRFGWLYVVRLSLLASAAWLALPFIGRQFWHGPLERALARVAESDLTFTHAHIDAVMQVAAGIFSYRMPQVIASTFVLTLTLVDVYAIYHKWRERDRLMAMARTYRKKTPAEGGPAGDAA